MGPCRLGLGHPHRRVGVAAAVDGSSAAPGFARGAVAMRTGGRPAPTVLGLPASVSADQAVPKRPAVSSPASRVDLLSSANLGISLRVNVVELGLSRLLIGFPELVRSCRHRHCHRNSAGLWAPPRASALAPRDAAVWRRWASFLAEASTARL